MSLRRGALALGAGFLLMGAAAEPPPPNYRPAITTDEGGLWAVFDNAEKEIQTSPLVVKDEALNAYVKNLVCELAGPQCPSLRVYILDSRN